MDQVIFDPQPETEELLGTSPIPPGFGSLKKRRLYSQIIVASVFLFRHYF